LIFWSLGRNAYFNSQERLKIEERCYRAAGIDVWNDTIAKLEKAKQENWLLYYLGISLKPSFKIAKSTSVWSVTEEDYNKLRDFVKNATLADFADYGRRIGATDILICKDPEQKVPWTHIVLENKYFAVLKIPSTQ
jgi:hypothetical protein